MKVFWHWVLTHKALIGAILAAVSGVLTGQMHTGNAIAAVIAAFSAGLKPTPTSTPES